MLADRTQNSMHDWHQMFSILSSKIRKMKYLFISVYLLISILGKAQSDIQIVKIKHQDRSVTVYAVNHSNKAYDIKVNISLQGMKLDSPIDSIISLPRGAEKKVALLIPTASKTNYKINFKAVAEEGNGDMSFYKEVPDVVIYTKNGQKKSTELRLYLQKHEIAFNEINATYDDKSMEVYEKMLRRRKIEKSLAHLPVVIIKGEVFHNIQDMKAFIKEHF